MVLFYSFLLGGTTIPHRPGHAPDNAKVSNLNQKWVHRGSTISNALRGPAATREKVYTSRGKLIYLSSETSIPFARKVYNYRDAPPYGVNQPKRASIARKRCTVAAFPS